MVFVASRARGTPVIPYAAAASRLYQCAGVFMEGRSAIFEWHDLDSGR